MRLRHLLAPLLLLSLTACGTSGATAFRASGETLKGLGQQFETVAKIYKTGCDAKTIKATDCETFRKFGEEFKKSYPLSVDLWTASYAAGDTTTQQATRDRITAMATELTRLAVIGYATFGGK